MDASGIPPEILYGVTLIDPLVRTEPKTNTSFENVQAADRRKENQEMTMKKKITFFFEESMLLVRNYWTIENLVSSVAGKQQLGTLSFNLRTWMRAKVPQVHLQAWLSYGYHNSKKTVWVFGYRYTHHQSTYVIRYIYTQTEGMDIWEKDKLAVDRNKCFKWEVILSIPIIIMKEYDQCSLIEIWNSMITEA